MDIRLVVLMLSIVVFIIGVGLFAVFYRLRTLLKLQLVMNDLVRDIYMWSGITYKELTEMGKQEAQELRQSIEEWRKSIKIKGGK
jgi:hypothetical protein